MPDHSLPCDGCGQPATPEHITRRLQRLEWTTRYRPVHIATLLLGAISPTADGDFLYAGQFGGEAGRLLSALGIEIETKAAEEVLTQLQRGGFLLTHVLECPLEGNYGAEVSTETLLARRASAGAVRIRRSLKPKRVVLISGQLASIMDRFSSSELGCPVLLDGDRPFVLDFPSPSGSDVTLRAALSGTAAAR